MSKQDDWSGCDGCGHLRITLGHKDCNHPRWDKFRLVEQETIRAGDCRCPHHTLKEAGSGGRR